MGKPPILGIIMPCYNEEQALLATLEVVTTHRKKLLESGAIDKNSFIGLVDDGSSDKTWELIVNSQKKFESIHAIKLAGNRGHQLALLAGLTYFGEKADAIVSLDADLQDDITAIDEMLLRFAEGNEIVYGVRKNRLHDSFFKKYTALCFYRGMSMLGVDIVHNHADYRLVSKRVIESLSGFREEKLFLRGIFPLMGYTSAQVYYDRGARKHGESKYPLRKMLSFAWTAVTSFSIKPLRMVTILGTIVFIASIAMSMYYVYSKFFLSVVPGWASLVLPIYLLGGIQLLAIGILGEYLGNIYIEVKQRPRYIIDKTI